MTFTLELPSEYGYVILSCVVGPFVTSTLMGVSVMGARSKCDVNYPNLYATPGYHKQADEFNRVQRGHQSLFESMGIFVPAALLSGLKYPLYVTGCGILYSVGSYLYLTGYADTTLAVDKARHMKGGPMRTLGLFMVVGSTVKLAGSMIGWWK